MLELEQWIKHRSLPSDENLRKLWQRLQAHVRNVAHMHRPPPQKESTLTNNMVEHSRHVAEQYRAGAAESLHTYIHTIQSYPDDNKPALPHPALPRWPGIA